MMIPDSGLFLGHPAIWHRTMRRCWWTKTMCI